MWPIGRRVLLVPAPSRRPSMAEMLTVAKQDGELFFVNFGGHESRHRSVIRLIRKADRTVGLPSFGTVEINTSDRPVGKRCLSFCTAAGYEDVAAPDFLFDSWPEVGIFDYEAVCRALADAGASPASSQVCGWIGNAATSPVRRALLAVAAQSDLLEAWHTPWPPDGSDRLTLVEQVQRWGLLLDVEGNGWSARLKLLLYSGRPVLVVDRPWREWWFGEFRAWEHFIPVRRDLADLEDRVGWAREHAAEAGRIGRAGQAFARRELTRERAVARWAEVLGGAAGS